MGQRNFIFIEADRVVMPSDEDLSRLCVSGHEEDRVQIPTIWDADEQERNARKMDRGRGHADLG